MQLLLQFLTNPSEILQVSSSEPVHVLFTKSLNYFFSLFSHFSLRLFLHGSEFVVGTL